MTDKNVVDFVNPYVIQRQLHLGTFTTVNNKMPVLNSEVLGGREPAVSRQRSTGAEDREFEIIQLARGWLIASSFRLSYLFQSHA